MTLVCSSLSLHEMVNQFNLGISANQVQNSSPTIDMKNLLVMHVCLTVGFVYLSMSILKMLAPIWTSLNS